MRTFDEYRRITEAALEPMLDSLGAIPDRLKEAMLYSLTAGGKRIRPSLLLGACESAGGSLEEALPFACALEMIHTYSLIHDDLPAMDNDDLRRGKPTSHKVFGENIAILAGDALLNGAAELMTRAAVRRNDMLGVRAMEIILRRAGVTGMIAGQTMDVLSEGELPREDLVRFIHSHKTADLLEAPVEAGLTLAGAAEEQIAAGREYAFHMGLAFQMTDDLLDVTGDAAVMGKNPGMDGNKMTWVAFRGVEDTKKDAADEVRKACEALRKLPWDLTAFAVFAEQLIHREQ